MAYLSITTPPLPPEPESLSKNTVETDLLLVARLQLAATYANGESLNTICKIAKFFYVLSIVGMGLGLLAFVIHMAGE
jgi:hypothetical protein